MVERMCIVTRQSGDATTLIRFVAGPDGTVVPDIKGNLPGRGCWVTATADRVAEAQRKQLFARALKMPVKADAELAEALDQLLARNLLGQFGLARKAGAVALGAAKVESVVRAGNAAFVLHALEAQPDGVRKIDQARRATIALGGPVTLAFKLYSEPELSLAFGGANVIHAAVLAGGIGKKCLEKALQLASYRGLAVGTGPDTAATAVQQTDTE
jgi:predicted RNA-binding protein YlxR (DUF448 family)